MTRVEDVTVKTTVQIGRIKIWFIVLKKLDLNCKHQKHKTKEIILDNKQGSNKRTEKKKSLNLQEPV